VKVIPSTLCSADAAGTAVAVWPADGDSLAKADADADSEAVAVSVAVAVAVAVAVPVGLAVGLAVGVTLGVAVGEAVGFGVAVGLGVGDGVGVGVANADGSVQLLTMYVGAKSMSPDESVPLIVHSPTVDGPTLVLRIVRAATLATNAATAAGLSQPTLCMAVSQLSSFGSMWYASVRSWNAGAVVTSESSGPEAGFTSAVR
jgi:hypothetical protein